jgi:hypothetical protein
MFCKQCGELTQPNDSFCGGCGSRTQSDAAVNAQPSAVTAHTRPVPRKSKSSLSGPRAVILWVGVSVVGAMCLVPPWRYTLDLQNRHDEKPAGYAPVFAPPKPYSHSTDNRSDLSMVAASNSPKGSIFDLVNPAERADDRYAIRVDLVRLGLQLVATTLLTATLIVTVASSRKT